VQAATRNRSVTRKKSKITSTDKSERQAIQLEADEDDSAEPADGLMAVGEDGCIRARSGRKVTARKKLDI